MVFKAHSAIDKDYGYVGVRITGRDLAGTLASIEDSWRQFVPHLPLQVEFLDQRFAQLYRREERLGRLLKSAAGLAILLACLGVGTLAAFALERRTREIGIRKVVGASLGDIFALLATEYTGLALAANLVAWPAAFWASEQWLTGFAYRAEFALAPFGLAAVAALATAWMAVGYQVTRAGRISAAEALRCQ